MNDSLPIKYRPKTWKEVIGQDVVVRSLRSALKNNVPHAFLFLGQSGCGKTTLARILATSLGCSPEGIIEIDAATHSGVDAMRQVLEGIKYRALAATPTKLIIIDECHALSKATFQALLLSIEEPPAHVYWALCTTEADKVPTTIKTRCQQYNVRSVPSTVLYDHLRIVAKQEKLTQVDDHMIQVCAKQAGGSVRQALVNLSTVRECADVDEAKHLLIDILEQGDVIKLARMLVEGRLTWKGAVQHFELLQDDSPENIRLVVVNYVAKVLLGTKDERKAQQLLSVLDSFSTPFSSNEKMAPLLLAVGRILYA